MENNWVSYKNGNYIVALDTVHGTKIRYNDLAFFKADRPENMDIKITNSCNMGCPFCFPENILVTTTQGNIPISQIKENDEVISYNFILNKQEKKKVKKLYQRPFSGNLIKIILENGTVIKATPNHKIFTKNRGYIEAQYLNEKDEVIII